MPPPPTSTRQHRRYQATLVSASRDGNVAAIQESLAWRGPHGEWADPRVDNHHALDSAVTHRHYDVACELLAWRGPGGEWVDPRRLFTGFQWMDPRRGVLVHSHDFMTTRLLAWRGPGGEWIDPRAYHHVIIRHVAAMELWNVVLALLAWRGPGGEWVDPRDHDHVIIRRAAASKEWAVVRHLLEWRGPAGEWVDPRAQECINDVIAAAAAHQDDENVVEVIRQLVAWRGPEGEYVDLRQSRYVMRRFSPTIPVHVLYEVLTWRCPQSREPVEWHDNYWFPHDDVKRRAIVLVEAARRHVSNPPTCPPPGDEHYRPDTWVGAGLSSVLSRRVTPLLPPLWRPYREAVEAYRRELIQCLTVAGLYKDVILGPISEMMGI